MKVYKFLPPYNAEGRTNFLYTKNRAGIYLIKEDNKLVYVGYSGYNVYKTLYRHFQQWNHHSQEVVSYKHRQRNHRYTVRVVLCTDRQAAALEKRLIQKYHPRDNSQQYTLQLAEQSPAQSAYMLKVEDTYFNTTPEDCPF